MFVSRILLSGANFQNRNEDQRNETKIKTSDNSIHQVLKIRKKHREINIPSFTGMNSQLKGQSKTDSPIYYLRLTSYSFHSIADVSRKIAEEQFLKPL